VGPLMCREGAWYLLWSVVENNKNNMFIYESSQYRLLFCFGNRQLAAMQGNASYPGFSVSTWFARKDKYAKEKNIVNKDTAR
jgi:hypothetical protein